MIIDSPLMRFYMSDAQNRAANSPVNDMGMGISSNAQRSASGNRFQSVEERRIKNKVGDLDTKLKEKKRKTIKDKNPDKTIGALESELETLREILGMNDPLDDGGTVGIEPVP